MLHHTVLHSNGSLPGGPVEVDRTDLEGVAFGCASNGVTDGAGVRKSRRLLNQEEDMEAAIRTLWTDESGQDLVEYVLIIVFIALAITVALTAFKDEISQAFSTTGSTLNSQVQ